MNILSIQSHVAFGHQGNRAAVFPLERMGFEVWPINTVQFSSHAGRPGWKGRVYSGDDISDIVSAMEGLGVLDRCDAVLSGYMGDISIGQSIVAAVDAAKRANPAAIYCCDPVMGDFPGGLYVREGIPGFMEREALPRADIVCPNLFEAERLWGSAIQSEADAAKAADAIHRLGPRIVVISSFSVAGDEGTGFFLSDGSHRRLLKTPLINFVRTPKGSGDLSTALFLGYYLQTGDPTEALERMASALYAVLEATEKAMKLETEETACETDNEMALIAAQDAIAAPPRRFKALEAAVGR